MSKEIENLMKEAKWKMWSPDHDASDGVDVLCNAITILDKRLDEIQEKLNEIRQGRSHPHLYG